MQTLRARRVFVVRPTRTRPTAIALRRDFLGRGATRHDHHVLAVVGTHVDRGSESVDFE
jgi:hypothetical protein